MPDGALMTERPFGDWAKRYRELGWLGTIPLPPGEKHPPPKGFTGSGRPHPTDHQVATWVKQQPDGNLGLRLSEVPSKYLKGRAEPLPQIYAGNNVDGWELLGIDVDHYATKQGYDELKELEAELGELPKAPVCTARWGTGSGTSIFLVPKGFRFMGKASNGIDIIQKRHRFTIGWPSRNPDANDAMYIWMYGAPHNLKLPKLFRKYDDIPPLSDVDVLPVAWFTHLSRGGTLETDDPISGLTDDDLIDWLRTLDFDYTDANGQPDMCEKMRRATAKWIAALEESTSSHDKLVPAHWELVRLAAEGHKGVGAALNEFHPAWWGHVAENRGGDADTAMAEINRSITGALDKTQPYYVNENGESLGRPDDTCSVDKSSFDTDGWADRLEADERVAEADFGGLGPIIGRMPLGDAKPASEYGRHDDGNAQHFVDLYGENAKYVAARKSWILWDGERWYRDNEDRLIRSAYRRVRLRQEAHARELKAIAAADPTDKGAKAFAKVWTDWAKRSGDLAPIKAALESARACFVGDEPVVLDASKLDGYVNLLGCSNGVIDLNDDDDIDVRPPRKEDYVTYNTNIDYIPWRALVNGEAGHFEAFDIWQEYLNWFLKDPELQRFVRKVLGHMLIGENPEKKIIFLHGPPDTGKSTLLGAIKGAIGDYHGTIDMNLFKQRDLNPGLVRAVPLRITSMSEMEDTTKSGIIDASVVKRLTGNDTIQAELKYSNEIFEGRPQFTTIIACNNPPEIRHADPALYERLLVLPLEHSIGKKQRRYERQKQIEEKCGSAVLSWLIEGWKDYRREGLDPDTWPDAVKKANRNFAADLNSVARYVNENLELAKNTDRGRRALTEATRKANEKNKKIVSCLPPVWTPEAARVYQHYVSVTKKMGDEPVDMQQFTRDMGVGRTDSRRMNGKNTSVYVGVRFKEEPDERTQKFQQRF